MTDLTSPSLSNPSGLRFDAGAATLVGQVRKANEDNYLVTDHLVAVADGMGGHAAGEVASALAVEVLSGVATSHDIRVVTDAVIEANSQIFLRSVSGSSERGMGTTLCVAAVVADGDGEGLAILNVGDSRVYLLANDELHQLSEDHSLVESMVRAGTLTEAQAAVHPQRNVITRALGVDGDTAVDAWMLRPADGDRLLLCSDGLYNELSNQVIQEILSTSATPDRAADELSILANESGGRDNITVVVADIYIHDGEHEELGSRLRWLGTSSGEPGRIGRSDDTATVPIVPAEATRLNLDDAVSAVDDEPSTADSATDAPTGASVGVKPGEPKPGGPDAPTGASAGVGSGEPERGEDFGSASDGVADRDVADDGARSAADSADADEDPLDPVEPDDPAGPGAPMAAEGPEGTAAGESPINEPRRPKWRTAAFILAIIVIIAGGISAILVATGQEWTVTAKGNSIVLRHNGISSLFGGADPEPATKVRLNELTENDREKVRNGQAFNSLAEAKRFVANLQTTTTTTTPSTSTTTTSTPPTSDPNAPASGPTGTEQPTQPNPATETTVPQAPATPEAGLAPPIPAPGQ